MPIVDEMLLESMQRVFFVELILLNAGLLSKTVCVVTGKHYVLAFKQFYKKIAGWIETSDIINHGPSFFGISDLLFIFGHILTADHSFIKNFTN